MNIQIFSSLRVRLMLLVLLGAIPLLILLIYSGLELRNHVADDVQREDTQLVMKAVNEQQRLVQETRQLLSVLALVPQVQNDDIASCNSFLAKLLGETTNYVNLGVIRPNGDLFCSGVPLQKAVNVKDRAYFKRTLKSRDFAIGDYQSGRITNIAVLVFSYPILDNKKQLKAVLFAALPLTWIKQQASEARLLPGSVLNVIDHSTHTLLAQYPESTVQIGSSVEKLELVEALHASGGEGTAKVTDLDGVVRLHTFRRLQDLPDGKEIYVSFGIPAKLVYAEANAIMVRNMAILIFVVALMLLFAWYVSNVMILRQVTGLLAVTRRLASGDLDARVEVSDSRNEISGLGRGFNQMAAALEQRDSEAKQAENMLRKSEEDLRRVVETVPDIIYTATATNNFAAAFVSPALTQILGFSPEEFVTDPDGWVTSIHDEDREQVITQIQFTVDNTEDSYSLEYRMWHKDGKTFRWFEDRASIDRDAAGHATALYGVMTDITERKRYIAELEHKALYDSLTELPNRCLLQDRLQYALKVAKRDALPVAVILIDVARLSDVNDILGHSGGDLVLQEIASRLQKSLRDSDTVARLGSDEFALVLPTVLFEHIDVTAAKIRSLFEQSITVEDTALEIEAVFGIALYPEHGDEPDILLQRANIALRAAKKATIDFSIYDPENDPGSLRQLKLFGELRQALTQKELFLYYQPQIDIRTNRIISVEALARWSHPVEGVIPPNDFIPMVEQSGLIKAFTLWVLEEAIEQLKRWSQQGIDLTIAVNLSARNLLDPHLPDAIAAMLESHNVSPEHLTLEVTESAIMTRPENALKLLTRLHDMGFKLSIDDFGTGYSSLAYLKKFPMDELKIDQSFVFGLATNDDDAIIVRSTIELAQNMGLKVVAEGVEDEDVLDMLSILNCDLAQGYYMSRPVPVQELESWLVESPWGLKND